MIDMILALLALVIAEAAVLAGAAIAREVRELTRKTGEKPEDAGDPAEDFEKKWREGLDAMMGYDASAARRAARRDEDEE